MKNEIIIEKSGRGDWIRTNDHLLPKQIRYQAALHPEHRRDIFLRLFVYFVYGFFKFCSYFLENIVRPLERLWPDAKTGFSIPAILLGSYRPLPFFQE